MAIFEKDFNKIARLVCAIREGNYYETAARLAGIAVSGVREWLRAAENGDERYLGIADVIHAAAAAAEAESVRDVRKAGKDPRNWAASMTYLERRYPDRWGRRQDDANVPRVLVQIGVKDSDVTVNIPSMPQPNETAAGSALTQSTRVRPLSPATTE